MNVYNYHPVTKEYISTSQADESPLEPGVFLIPGSATTVAPAAADAGFVMVFENDAWAPKEDYRGTAAYATASGVESKVLELGPIAAGFTLLAYPGPSYSWVADAWAFDSTKALVAIRSERDGKLLTCDFTQLADVPLSPEKKAEWAAYRALLRDFPETCDPAAPVWPVEPA
jgi:hypothetical protein